MLWECLEPLHLRTIYLGRKWEDAGSLHRPSSLIKVIPRGIFSSRIKVVSPAPLGSHGGRQISPTAWHFITVLKWGKEPNSLWIHWSTPSLGCYLPLCPLLQDRKRDTYSPLIDDHMATITRETNLSPLILPLLQDQDRASPGP